MPETTRLPVRVEPNVTPMIDVMLVLLIIFMVVAPALVEDSPIMLPSAANLRDHDDDVLQRVVAIDRNGVYYLNKRAVSRDELQARLRATFAERPDDRVVYVKADRSGSYDRVLDAFEIARTSGGAMAALITEQRR